MREIKYRAWDIDNKEMYYDVQSLYDGNIRFSESRSFSNRCFGDLIEAKEKIVLMQYTGLKDKNGKEIYENMILDDEWEVIYQAPKYILKNISNNDILDIYENKHTITKEYSKL